MQADIIYGTAWKKQATAKLVIAAVLAGFRAIDTACQLKHYREDLVGEALQELKDRHNIPRESLYLQTKFTSIDGQDRSQPLPYDPKASIRSQLLSSFQTSLKNLRTTYLDSYILHSPLHTISQTIEAWRVLVQLQDEGKVKAIGMSNTYDVGILRSLEDVRKVQVVQNRWYEGNGWDADVLKYCVDNGVQYQSFWTLTGSPILLNHSSMNALATSLSITPQQAIYKFAQLNGITPLSGTTSEEHMKEDLMLGNIPMDSEDENFQSIRSLVFE